MAEQRDMNGVLFVNDRKTADKHPDYKGSVTVNGVGYWLAGWLRSGQKGEYISLAVKPKDETAANSSASPRQSAFPRPGGQQAAQPQAAQAQPDPPYTDDCPF